MWEAAVWSMAGAMMLAAGPETKAGSDAKAKPEAKDVFAERSAVVTAGKYKEETFKYRLLSPATVEPGKTYPVVLFLHGAGERGDDNAVQLKHFPVRMISETNREKYPCFLIAPQCRKDQKWVDVSWSDPKATDQPSEPSAQMVAAVAALEDVLKNFPCDRSRIYLTGLSMGGYGSWDLGARNPEWFAAIAPICGGGDPKAAAKFVGKPVWAWHGDKDTAVPVGRSRAMIEAIKAAGGEPKYTELPGVGHNSWDDAYGKADGVLPWLFEQKLAAPLPEGPLVIRTTPKPAPEETPAGEKKPAEAKTAK